MRTKHSPMTPEQLYQPLSPAMSRLAQRGTLCRYPKHCIVINEGEPGDSVYVMLQGRAKAYSAGDGDREITYEIIDAGDLFAELSLDGAPRPASVMTLAPSTCAVISRTAFEGQMLDDPDLMREVLQRIIRRARMATASARSMALFDVYSRMVTLLEANARQLGPVLPVTLEQITHQQIAGHVGASREMVSRLLNDLQKGGYVELGTKRITIRQPLPQRW